MWSFFTAASSRFWWSISPLTDLRPCFCLPSSSYTAKAKSHPLGDGVRPHLPSSEFVCVDELWTNSAGMFFCGGYKGQCSNWEASTKLSHNDFFVLARLSGGGSLHNKQPKHPTTPLHTQSLKIPLTSQQSYKLWTQTWRFHWDLEDVFPTLELLVHNMKRFLRIHIFLSSWGL